MIPISNNLLVKLKKKFYDTVTFDSGTTLHIDPSFHPEEYAMLTAEIVETPLRIIVRPDYNGFVADMLKPGDEILCRYDLVFAYFDQPERDTPIYKNLIIRFNEKTGEHEEFWLCDIQKVFAFRRNVLPEWQTINGYVMAEPIMERVENSSFLIIPDYLKTPALTSKVRVVSIGGENKYNIMPNDTVIVNPHLAQKYQIDSKTFWIFKDSHILAK